MDTRIGTGVPPSSDGGSMEGQPSAAAFQAAAQAAGQEATSPGAIPVQEFLFARPPVIPRAPVEEAVPRFRVPIPRTGGAEGAKDIPSWARGARPQVGESGGDFAQRLLDEKYGNGNYPRGPGSEYNKIRKWGDRNFQDPPSVVPFLLGQPGEVI